jgi:predicted ATP-dependent endonuclease of OLD family
MADEARIESVRTRGFRSVVDSTHVSLTRDVTILVGPNGAGKTNFMRSISHIDTVDDISHERPKYEDQEERSPDPRPVISARIDESLTDSEPLNALIQPPSVESVSSPEEVAVINFPITIERSASGKHTIRDDKNRREIIELASLRIEEIRQVVDDIEDLVPSESKKLEDTRLQERLASYKEAVEDEIKERYETKLAPDENLQDEYSQDLIDDYKHFQNVNEDIENLLQKLVLLQEIKENKKLAIPAVHYFDGQEPIEDEVAVGELDSSEAYTSIFKIANLSGKNANVSDYSTKEIKKRLTETERDLTTLLNEFLEIDEPMDDSVGEAVTDPTEGRFTVEISVNEQDDTRYVSLDVSDTAEKGFSTLLTERSTGAKWLLSFLLGFIELSFTGDGPGIVVYDDPGLPLHPRWKRQLRRILYAVDTEYQVVYSTHSPFLIRNDQTDQIRIARNHGASEYGETDDCGTKLYSLREVNGSDYVHDRLDPVRSSLGAPIAESLFGGERNVVVEGPTDRQYLEAFSSLFDDNHGKISFDKDTHLMPGNGSNADVLASFLEVEQPNYVVLTDSDSDGQSIRDSMVDSGIPTDKSTDLSNTLPNMDVRNPEIEDLLPRELVCKHVSEYSGTDKDELITKARDYNKWAIVSLVEEEFDIDFPKKYVARKISGQIDSDWLNASNDSRLRASLNFALVIDTLRSRLDNNT